MNLHPLSVVVVTMCTLGSMSSVVGDGTAVHRVAFATPADPVIAIKKSISIHNYDTYVAEVLARPLFSPTRRPDQITGPIGNVATVAGVPRLSGILVNGADRRAIFAGSEQSGRVQSIVAREGETVGAYHVKSVTLDAVTLTGPGGEHVLRPRFSTAPLANGPPRLQIPSNMVDIGSPHLDPNRFDAPVGPMGLAMYRYDPAAPHAPTPVAPALTSH